MQTLSNDTAAWVGSAVFSLAQGLNFYQKNFSAKKTNSFRKWKVSWKEEPLFGENEKAFSKLLSGRRVLCLDWSQKQMMINQNK